MSVRDRLTDPGRSFTKAEMKVVRELLANYPVGGLTTVSSLARRAHVSDPTVVRLVAKLGYEGFGELQKSLLAEVDAHLNSPLTILAGRRSEPANDDLLRQFLSGMAGATQATGDEIVKAEFEAATDLLADRRKRVLCLGGRFSRHLAGILRWHLQQLRSQVESLVDPEMELPDRLIDVGPRDVLVVYDFRRYQANVVHFAREAHARGCRTILVTDKWRSPVSEFAEIVLPVPVESSSLFDTMVPALALTEALIAAVTTRVTEKLDERLQQIESIRSRYQEAFNGDV